jgi:hypothetical protein
MGVDMLERIEIRLRDGTLVRHKKRGYQGKIEGTTAIKACFTRDGTLLNTPVTKEAFQYRVAVSGESMRQIAPEEDLEVLDATADIECVICHKMFRTKPGLVGKAGGRCSCGSWICTACLGCQAEEATAAARCKNQRKRVLKKLANVK